MYFYPVCLIYLNFLCGVEPKWFIVRLFYMYILSGLSGWEMYLKEVQVEDRRPLPSGRSWETWSERRNPWMSWSSPVQLSWDSWLKTKTVKDILYTRLRHRTHICRYSGFGHITNILTATTAVTILDPELHAGIRDVPGHPLHRQPQRSDCHRCQSPCRDQAGGSRDGRGKSSSAAATLNHRNPWLFFFINMSLRIKVRLCSGWGLQIQIQWYYTNTTRMKRGNIIHTKVMLNLIWLCVVSFSQQQGSLQIYLKSKNGPIEVYLCPEEGLEEVSPVKSLLTPKKEFPLPLAPPSTTAIAPSSFTVKEEPVECKRRFCFVI